MDKSEQSSPPESQNYDSPGRIKLERIRQNLLDTSTRNCLIDCSLDPAQALRLVDGFPDQMYARLREGKPFDLAPVPAPTHSELLEDAYIAYSTDSDECIKETYPEPDSWARRQGIDTNYDLPSGQSCEDSPTERHNVLQTLRFPDSLNTQLGKMRHLANMTRQETGANSLYLALGFLEWYESRSSDKRRLAPLFVVPIDLNRGKPASGDGLRSYHVTLRDDGLLNNVSLSQRMLNDFGIELPKVTDESEPEHYLDNIRDIISRQKDARWNVKRYAAICLLDFTSQLIYEDLDPSRWPKDKHLAEHPLVQRILTASENDQQHATTETITEHHIDDIEHLHTVYPLVVDADDSQYSALIDVINGHNLVIEAPPGTGKSQTITNVIAACINKGLSVLFVAEKVAALESVKRSLDTAELGDFCLEIHAQSSSKLSIPDSLMNSHRRRETAATPSELEPLINQYEEHKNHLRRYTEKLNSPWKNSGLTPHDILQNAVDLRERTPLNRETNLVRLEDASQITSALIADTLKAAEHLLVEFKMVVEQTPTAAISAHPWIGARNADMAASQRHTLFSALEQWTDRQGDIITLWRQLQLALQIDSVDTPNQEKLIDLMETLDNLPPDIPEALLKRIDELRHNKADLETIAQKRFDYREQFSQLADHIKAEDITSHKRAIHTTSGLLKLCDELGLTGSAPLGKVHAHCEQLDALQSRVKTLNDRKTELLEIVPQAFHDVFDNTINGARSLIELLDIASELPLKLWQHRHERYTNPEFTQALDEIKPIIRSLRQHRAQLSGIFDTSHLPFSQTLDKLVHALRDNSVSRLLNKEYREAKDVLSKFMLTEIKPAEGIDALPVLLQYQQELEEFIAKYSQHPALGSAFAGLDTDLKLHRKMLSWYQSVDEQFGQHSPKAAALFTVDIQTAKLLTDAAASELNAKANSIVNSLAKLHSLYPQFFDQSNDDTSILDPALGLAGLKHHIEDCVGLIGDSMLDSSRPLSELIDVANRWLNCINDHSQWTQEESYLRFVPSLFAIDTDPDVDDSYAVSSLSTAQYLAGLASSSNLFLEAMLQEPTLSQLSRLREAQPTLIEHLDAAAIEQERFETTGNVDPKQWLNNCQTMSLCIERNKHALQEVDTLATWLSYERVKQKAESEKLLGLIECLENGSLPADQAGLAVEADLYQQLAAHLMDVDTELARLDGSEINAIRKQFQRCHQQLQIVQRQQIAANCTETGIPSGNNHGAIDTFTEFGLIKHDASKKSRHSAIRSLLKRAPVSIRALKPCFMMSPSSVAQYLEPGQYEFDVIVLDEASQIRTEAALGAMARAKQVVVVGDSKQLPPAPLYSESPRPGHAEAILDAAATLFPTRTLQWHYQSQHESLMSFSNENFYSSKLNIFPSLSGKSDESGIRFTRMTHATEKDSVNQNEAERIVDLLIKIVMHQSLESVGVIAMNGKQRCQIEAQLEQRCASNELLQRALEHNHESDEPLFIKTLENVQGDKRDLIVISMTYAPDISDGLVNQTFTPINSDIGWRALNVLLTRARKRMEIFCSIGSDDIRVDNNSNRGVRCLHTLLKYCESGCLIDKTHTHRQPETAFQRAVIRKLSKAGFSAQSNAGVSGFFIDIAVHNPDKPDQYLMGIECDSANYHPTTSVSDREQTRRQVLENMGWKIRRVCSTDYYRDADAQLQPILTELEEMRAKSDSTDISSARAN